MADAKLTALTADTAPTSDDLIYLVNDPGGTPASKKATLANVAKALVAGSDTQVQFNDAGTFGGDAGLTYNKTTNVLSVNGSANTLESAGSSTGNPVTLTATGGDPEIPLWLKPKGMGNGQFKSFVNISPTAPNLAELFTGFLGSPGIVLATENGEDGDFLQWAASNSYTNHIHAASGGTLTLPTAVSGDNKIVGLFTWRAYDGAGWNLIAELQARLDAGDITRGYLRINNTDGEGGEIARFTSDKRVTLGGVGATNPALKAGSSLLTFRKADESGDINIQALNARFSGLTSNGFVKTSGGDGTLSVDTNTYLTAATGFTVGKHIAVPQIAFRI